MELGRLRYMFEQIARNFAAMGEEAAASATADHIAKYWDRRMKAALIAGGGSGLSPIAAAALERVGREMVPPDSP